QRLASRGARNVVELGHRHLGQAFVVGDGAGVDVFTKLREDLFAQIRHPLDGPLHCLGLCNSKTRVLALESGNWKHDDGGEKTRRRPNLLQQERLAESSLCNEEARRAGDPAHERRSRTVPLSQARLASRTSAMTPSR